MKRARTSEVWTNFTIESEDKKIAVCNICQQKCSYKTTVSNLKKHIQSKHIGVIPASSQLRQLPEEIIGNIDNETRSLNTTESLTQTLSVQPGPSTLSSDQQPTTSSSNISKASDTRLIQTQIKMPIKKMTAIQKSAIDEKLLLLFIKDFQPFSIVEDKGFREYTNALNPAYHPPTRQHISNTLIPTLYEKTLNKMRNIDLKNIPSLSLTTDLWTSASQDAYIAVMAHYINEEFESCNLLLECAPLPSPHAGKHVAEEITRLMTELQIDKRQILIVTTDNAPSMKNAVRDYLELKHFGCFAHTLNLILENALDLAPIKSLVEAVKIIVAHYKRSTAAMEKLLRYQTQNGVSQPKRLLQAVPTRWNSVYTMLERFLELQDALKSTAGLLDKTLPMPSSEEWGMCKDLCNVLKPIQEVTQQMSMENYVTGSLVIVYNRVLRNVYEHKIPSNIHPEVRKAAIVIVDQLKSRLGQIEFSATYATCTLLDPRYKAKCFHDKVATEKAKKGLIELVTIELNKKNEIASTLASATTSTDKSDISQNEKNKEFSIWDNLNEILGPVETTQTPLASAIIEVQRYLEDRLLPIKDEFGNLNNPAKWWQNHQYIYPNLAKLYRLKCCAMSTSVPCERIFSKSGYLISDRRTRLKPEKVKQLMFLNVNM